MSPPIYREEAEAQRGRAVRDRSQGRLPGAPAVGRGQEGRLSPGVRASGGEQGSGREGTP